MASPWAEKRAVAMGWLEVSRLAERLRRGRQGRPLLMLADERAGAGREPGATPRGPGGRSPRPATFDPERGDDGGRLGR